MRSRFRSRNVDFSTFEVVYSRELRQNEDTDQLLTGQIFHVPCIELRGGLASSIFRVVSTSLLVSFPDYNEPEYETKFSEDIHVHVVYHEAQMFAVSARRIFRF